MMREHRVSFPEVALIAVTRGMIGFGIGMLVAPRVGKEHRALIGEIFLAIGALSTIPIAIRFFRRNKSINGVRPREEVPAPAY